MHDDVPLAIQEMSGELCRDDRERWLGADEPRWELYYAIVYLACTAIIEAGPISATGRLTATLALAALVPWYLIVGRPVMRLDYGSWLDARESWRATGYLAGLILLFAIVQSQETNAWFLAFALSPQCFHITGRGRGMAFVIVLNLTGAILLAVRVPGAGVKVTAAAIAVFAITFWVYSRWTLRVTERSLERAVLIEQLESTRAELAAANHQAGVLAERQRLAGEIHDTLAQGFTSIVTLIQAAEALLVPEPEPVAAARRHLDLALATARENLVEARTLVAALSPAELESGTLGDAVRRVAETTATGADIRCSAEVTGDARPLPMSTEVVLLRVCQEALANVRKHAGARMARVRLSYGDQTTRLEITDDGCGFDAVVAHDGYGLRGMRQRIGQAGGTIEVRTSPGAGTAVRAEVPG